ncbi:MAG: Ribonuclease Z [Ktedonobacterales bacterium]|jgi:ribonuclease Z|nr:MAG: Ribonuclease Z [Ktedonobacterales bacterium]
MAIEYQVLGRASGDNALFARVSTGQTTHRLLFDCGAGCLNMLAIGDLLAVDHLCFSHLHMDHIGGFDTFIRANYNRTSKPVRIWGPPETARILHHRLQGFLWNLYEDDPGTWYVHDVFPDHITAHCFEAHEAFATAHDAAERPNTGAVIETPAYTIEALTLDHHTPSLAYILRERPHVNVATERLAELGLAPGPWLKQVKEPQPDEAPEIEIGGARYALAALREALLIESPGGSLAYLTDFLLDDAAVARLVPALRGCDTMICESQYRTAEAALAQRHHHLTAIQAAELARRAEVGELILFHLSDRYRPSEWLALLGEARAIFANTRFPAHWQLED